MHVAIQPVASLSSSGRTAGIMMDSGEDNCQMACSASNAEIDAGNCGQKFEERGLQPNDLVLGSMLDAALSDVAKWRCKAAEHIINSSLIKGRESKRPHQFGAVHHAH